MADTGCARRRIAGAAFSRHAGEHGFYGQEDIEINAPAVQRGAARGIACSGPFPADTVFIKAFGDDYDGVLTMYHDQGQIATKLKGFNRGVTVSGGLKTVFTTPAHGTAYDIPGRGMASTGALEQAVRLPAKLPGRPAKETQGGAPYGLTPRGHPGGGGPPPHSTHPSRPYPTVPY